MKKITHFVFALGFVFLSLFTGCDAKTQNGGSASQPEIIDVSNSMLESSSDSEQDLTTPVTTGSLSSPGQSDDFKFDESEFADYIAYFSGFFFYPIENQNEIKHDYYTAFFLLHTAYLESENGNIPKLETNENLFYVVPDEALINIAEKYLGVVDFDVSRISEWPMGIDLITGEKQYSTESSLPTCELSISTLNVDNMIVTADVTINNSLDEEVDRSKQMVYTFKIVLDPNNDPVYQLVTIE